MWAFIYSFGFGKANLHLTANPWDLLQWHSDVTKRLSAGNIASPQKTELGPGEPSRVKASTLPGSLFSPGPHDPPSASLSCFSCQTLTLHQVYMGQESPWPLVSCLIFGLFFFLTQREILNGTSHGSGVWPWSHKLPKELLKISW